MEEIIKIVSTYTGIPLESLKGKSRQAEIIKARMICYKLMRGEKNYKKYGSINHGYRISLASIGMYFNKDHATVLNGIVKLNNYLETEPETKKMYNNIELKIESNCIIFSSIESDIINNAHCIAQY
jgi:chromosomal replication initiation ATPase DnaA